MNKTLSSRFRWFAYSAALCAMLVSTGCITRQVREGINEAEVASVSADYGLGAADPSGVKPGGGWQVASAKIDAIITQHPENPSMKATLRVRQAVMLLNNQQINLAKAAFDEAPLTDLHTPRDQTLKKLEKELCWWYQIAKSKEGIDYSEARKALDQIIKIRGGLKQSENEQMRDWLAALRAWIALRMANDADNANLGAGSSLRFLEDALNTFASMLPQGETTSWLKVPNFPDTLTAETAITGSNRRRFYANDLIQGAKKAMQQNAIPQPNVQDAYFKDRLAH